MSGEADGLPLLSDVAGAAEHCSYCPKMCRFACPVAEATGKESVTPWGIDRVVAAMARGDELTAQQQAPVWACTGCRQCGGACLPGLDLPSHVRAARAVAAKPEGIGEAAGVACGPGEALRAGATAGADIVVYPGCRSQDGAALGALLSAAGVAYDVVAAPTCCGARDADIGEPDTARRRVADLDPHLAGGRQIVVADPHCARWLAWDRGDARVLALPAFLATIADRIPWRQDADVVAWHDPCWLGRGMTSYETPRQVIMLASGTVPLEPEHSRDRAWCTGGGMGYPQADPVGAEEILRRRAAELVATGATATVTACPTAASRLRDAGLDAHDFAAYLVQRLQ